MNISKSRRDLSEDLDFSKQLRNSLTLARANANANASKEPSRPSSRESYRSLQGGQGNLESGDWDYGAYMKKHEDLRIWTPRNIEFDIA